MQKNYKQINGKFGIFWIKNYRKIYEILYIKAVNDIKGNLLIIQIYLGVYKILLDFVVHSEAKFYLIRDIHVEEN